MNGWFSVESLDTGPDVRYNLDCRAPRAPECSLSFCLLRLCYWHQRQHRASRGQDCSYTTSASRSSPLRLPSYHVPLKEWLSLSSSRHELLAGLLNTALLRRLL